MHKIEIEDAIIVTSFMEGPFVGSRHMCYAILYRNFSMSIVYSGQKKKFINHCQMQEQKMFIIAY